MNRSNSCRINRPSRAHKLLLALICLSSAFLFPPKTSPQVILSLKAQATEWLMQDAPPNPPLRGWLDGLSMMIKEKTNKDAPVQITSTVLPSGLVEVQAKVATNVFIWQVDYPKRKYYCMNKFTSNWMALIAKGGALR